MLESRAVYKRNLKNKRDQKYEARLQLNFNQKIEKVISSSNRIIRLEIRLGKESVQAPN